MARDDSPTPTGETKNSPQQFAKWILVVAVIALLAAWILTENSSQTQPVRIPYNDFIAQAREGRIAEAKISNDTGVITGRQQGTDGQEGAEFIVEGPIPVIEDDIATLRNNGVTLEFETKTTGALASLIPLLLPVLLLIGFFVWLSRRQSGAASGVMGSVGRSKARVYTTERPKTTFNDVAGYTGVKTEITEVVDFLKSPQRFRDIGAKIPKGVLLVGPPGTGKTLLARAVAGEAGVPFLSITGSDFMEMFVGVGASRVRDLFQTARKQAPAIIFIDEIDSIGRKRGAGVGGGHDEREQTLNQMLSEMDGFETSEGNVVMAATNRPDILDPALLRPGRFDRQIVVPLPDYEERLPILQVHCKGKKIADDVELEIVARGTPGMSGADLSNLVNEAALHAVRRNATEIHMQDFDAARDRVLMGQRRESVVLNEKEKETTAYHEGGHALLAYVLPNADPVHKVTIIPTGMALGVTQTLPSEERHSYDMPFFRDYLAMVMGGRCAEKLIYDTLTSGASNDLQKATSIARRMVREFGMSEIIGPMAWGDNDMVFLGEDMMQTRTYSDETSRVIDVEVERILREAEAHALATLEEHRKGLEAIAMALLERETIDGLEVARLVDDAYGRPVHAGGKKVAPSLLANGPGPVGTPSESPVDSTIAD